MLDEMCGATLILGCFFFFYQVLKQVPICLCCVCNAVLLKMSPENVSSTAKLHLTLHQREAEGMMSEF